MGQYVPLFIPGQAQTRQVSADVIGGRLVAVSGSGTVAHAAAGSTSWLAVAGFDAKAGEQVTLHSGGVQRPTASGAIAAADLVAAAADGLVASSAAPGVGQLVGVAITSASDGEPVEVQFVR